MNIDEKERAKQIIVEIIRQSGGEFHNKTNMYKAFWKAHLEFARKNPGYLSLWPIVRMPKGPGIDRFDQLIGELMEEGVLKIRDANSVNMTGCMFSLIDNPPHSNLTPEQSVAVKAGVEFVKNRTASAVSDASHDLSRSWNEASNGEELDVYIDLMSEDEYKQKIEKMKRLSAAFEDAAS